MKPWNMEHEPGTLAIDRLRRLDNGGCNGVSASRRYVHARQTKQEGQEVRPLAPQPAVPGKPCLPASGTLQNDLRGLLLDPAGAMLRVKRRPYCM
jgi:hypothetical protein